VSSLPGFVRCETPGLHLKTAISSMVLMDGVQRPGLCAGVELSEFTTLGQ
jgi:hypothetical protein